MQKGNTLTKPEKKLAIDELVKELSVLKEQKSRLDNEANHWAQKRDRFNEQFKTARVEIDTLRNARDKINEKVGQLKQKRDNINAVIGEKIEQAKMHNQERKNLTEKKPQRSCQTLQKEFDDVEWKIQTTSLPLQEEKTLVEQAKRLETQLNIHKRIDRLTQQLMALQEEIEKLKTERKLYHEKMTEEAQKSRETHEKMVSRIAESKKMKDEADNLHKHFIDVKAKAKPLQNQMEEVLSQIRQLKGKIKDEELKEKKETEDALRESLAKQAMEKLKRGEKLSWEEFQVLAEKGITAQG